MEWLSTFIHVHKAQTYMPGVLFTQNSRITLQHISRKLGTLRVSVQVNSHQTRHSAESLVFALLSPLDSVKLRSRSKVHFPSSCSRPRTLQNKNIWKSETSTLPIAAAVRLVNRSEDKSTFFNPKTLNSEPQKLHIVRCIRVCFFFFLDLVPDDLKQHGCRQLSDRNRRYKSVFWMNRVNLSFRLQTSKKLAH